MAIGPKLSVWVDPTSVVDRSDAPAPSKSDVLYSPPSSNGQRKRCGNCALYMPTSETCAVLDAEYVASDMVCGYHVTGEPSDTSQLQVSVPVPVALAGLVDAPDGSACENCRWYRRQSQREGSCSAVEDAGAPAIVEALGCCTRWESAT